MEGALLGQLQVEFLQAGVCGPRGVVQIVHGVAEHIGRYDAPARFLASRGYLRAADKLLYSIPQKMGSSQPICSRRERIVPAWKAPSWANSRACAKALSALACDHRLAFRRLSAAYFLITESPPAGSPRVEEWVQRGRREGQCQG